VSFTERCYLEVANFNILLASHMPSHQWTIPPVPLPSVPLQRWRFPLAPAQSTFMRIRATVKLSTATTRRVNMIPESALAHN
jgi:hypothetical protein